MVSSSLFPVEAKTTKAPLCVRVRCNISALQAWTKRKQCFKNTQNKTMLLKQDPSYTLHLAIAENRAEFMHRLG